MRLRRRWVVVVVVVVVCVGVLLVMGWPQRVGAEWAAERALGARVEIEGLGLLGTARVASLRVYDDAGEAPVLDVRDAVVTYRLFPGDGRRIERVEARFVGIDLDAQAPGKTNFDFLTRLLNKPKKEDKGDPLAFVPGSFRVDMLSGRARFPGMSVAINGLQAEGRVPSLEGLSASVKGEKLEGEWSVPSQGVSGRFTDGRVVVEAVRDGLRARLKPIMILLPGLVDIQGGAEAWAGIGTSGPERSLELDLPRCRVQGADLSQAKWSFAPFPVKFKSADLSGTKLKMISNPDGFFIPMAEVRGSAEELGLGLAGQEWYEGALQVTGQGKDRAYTLEAVLNEGQKVVAEAKGTPMEAQATVRLEGWSREELMDAMPKAYRATLEKWPQVQGISGKVDLTWWKPRYQVKGSLEAKLPDGAMPVEVEGEGNLTEGPYFAGKVAGKFGGGLVETYPAFHANRRIDLQVKLDKVAFASMVGLFSKTTAFEAAGSKVSGEVRVSILQPDQAPGNGKAELRFEPSPLPQVIAPAESELGVAGKFGLEGGFARLNGKQLDLSSGEDVRFALKDWSLTSKGFVLKGNLEGDAPAARLAPLAKLGVTGLVKTAAKVSYEKGKVKAPFEVAIDEAGFKTYSAAPGVPVSAKGTLNYDVAGAKGSVDGLKGDWTEGTTFAVEPIRFTSALRVEDSTYTVETDLSPLIYLGMLPDVEGRATARGVFRYAEGFTTEAEVGLEAAQMTLPNKLAVMGGAALRGTFRYTGGLSGEGRFGAAKVTAAGATLANVEGPFTLKEGRVVSDALTARLWDGDVKGEMDAGLFVENMPVKANATVAGLNLDTFTREYKPPKSRFTGIGGGSVGLVWSKTGFEDLTVELRTDEAFSVNRDLVYQLLMSGYIKDVRGGQRVDKIVERVLGGDEMRSFEQGELSLGMETEDISGQARLNSESLKLTVDINMEWEALASLLQLRQEQNLENIDTIRAEPVQLGASQTER